MPSNQKKIRDLERLLKKRSLQNNDDNEIVQNQIISKIDEVKKNKDEIMNKEKERKNATKYHMVKFLERKKITRMIKTIETKLLNLDCNLEVRNQTILLNKKEKLLEDLAYIMYYPNELKYIALCPAKSNVKDFDESSKKSKIISVKARTIALGRWNDDKYDSDKIDKVAYAMQVAYHGKNKDIVNKGLDNISRNKIEETNYNYDSSDNNKTSRINKDDGECDESTYIRSKSKKKTSKKDGNNNLNDHTAKSESTIKPTIETQLSLTSTELEDDFLIEEEIAHSTYNSNISQTDNRNLQLPNTSNHYNNPRQDRTSIHDIRFAATKRKYEKHQRVFKNQQLRANNNKNTSKKKRFRD